jgi:hypothetical protein
MENGYLDGNSPQAAALARRIEDYNAALAFRTTELMEDLDYFESRLADLQQFDSVRGDKLRFIYIEHVRRIRKLLAAAEDGRPKLWDRYPE